jgi:hypothetical protein
MPLKAAGDLSEYFKVSIFPLGGLFVVQSCTGGGVSFFVR